MTPDEVRNTILGAFEQPQPEWLKDHLVNINAFMSVMPHAEASIISVRSDTPGFSDLTKENEEGEVDSLFDESDVSFFWDKLQEPELGVPYDEDRGDLGRHYHFNMTATERVHLSTRTLRNLLDYMNFPPEVEDVEPPPGLPPEEIHFLEPKMLDWMAHAMSGLMDKERQLGFRMLWRDSYLRPPERFIGVLSMEWESFIILYEHRGGYLPGKPGGDGSDAMEGCPLIMIAGTQPFETPLHPYFGVIPKEDKPERLLGGQSIPEDEATLFFNDVPEAFWWENMCNAEVGSGMLLQSIFLQSAMGLTLDITKPYEKPQWDGIRLLPLTDPTV